MRCSLATTTVFALFAAAASAQDTPQVVGPPAPPPPTAADVVGIWHIDAAATGENMLQSLKDVEGEQLETNKKFYAVILEALKDSEYRLFGDGTYRARVGGKTKLAFSRGTWSVEGRQLRLQQTHLEKEERPETHLAEIDGDKLTFMPQEGGGTPSFVLVRDRLTDPWVVDVAASQAAIDEQLAGLAKADADVRRTALESVLNAYRDARFEFDVGNRWQATLGSADDAPHVEGKWLQRGDQLRLKQTQRNGTPAPAQHDATRADGRIVFTAPNFTLVLVPAAP